MLDTDLAVRIGMNSKRKLEIADLNKSEIIKRDYTIRNLNARKRLKRDFSDVNFVENTIAEWNKLSDSHHGRKRRKKAQNAIIKKLILSHLSQIEIQRMIKVGTSRIRKLKIELTERNIFVPKEPRFIHRDALLDADKTNISNDLNTWKIKTATNSSLSSSSISIQYFDRQSYHKNVTWRNLWWDYVLKMRGENNRSLS